MMIHVSNLSTLQKKPRLPSQPDIVPDSVGYGHSEILFKETKQNYHHKRNTLREKSMQTT